jgi:hypothetical protein
MVSHHRHATSGGRYDVIVSAENIEEPFSERFCFGVQAGIGEWLATARLLRGIVDFQAEVFQYIDRRNADLRVELVDVAGDK